MTDPPVILLSVLSALPIAVFLHELGHVLAGRAAGFVVTSFGLGTGRPFLVLPIRGVRLFFGLAHPLQGLTFAYLPELQATRPKLTAYTSGGILANGVAAAVSLALWRGTTWGGPFWVASAAINALIGAVSLIPLNVRVGKAPLRTDGALILQALRSGSVTSSAPATIQALAGFRGLWESIGDTMILRLYLLSAAAAWVDLGNPDRAEADFREAESIPGSRPLHFVGLAALVRAEIAIARRLAAEAESSLMDAEAAYRASGQSAGLYLVNLLRVSVLAIEEGSTRAPIELDVLATSPTAKSHPELAMATLSARVQFACSGSDEGAVEASLADYEMRRLRRPSATRDLRAYGALARFRSAREDPSRAEAAYRRFLAAIRELADGWANDNERSSFLESQATLIAEARASLRAGGHAAEADRAFERDVESDRIARDAERDRKYRRWGLLGMLINVAGFAVAAGVATLLSEERAGPFLFSALILAFFTILGVLYLGFDLTVGRLLPALRRFSGVILLTFAYAPWVGGLCHLILWILAVDPVRERSP